MAGIKGVLLDIDGVLVTSWHPIGGAVDAMRELRERGLARAYLTNTTSRTCREIAESLRAAGFEADPDEIVTAARLTAEYLRSTYPGARVWVLNSGDITPDLDGIELDEHDPQVVVLGGAGPEFTHRALSRVLELMFDGVPVVAMHRGTTWATRDGLRLDTGAYLPGLEEVSGASVVSVGKPSLSAFLTATDVMGTEPDATVMVGDDLTADVLAAQSVGLTGVLVRTGKFRQSVLDLSERRPDHVIDSVAQLPALLDGLA
ncbi:MAG: HAD-IIA family hydrolase [Rhodococcus sp. (in: high G+C Gram-positive bacteria)]|uniref:HAD-IIA family hydrolase n=1 Tax=Rhodococcus sp. TaxID=1831 RepID=UPI003BB128CA